MVACPPPWAVGANRLRPVEYFLLGSSVGSCGCSTGKTSKQVKSTCPYTHVEKPITFQNQRNRGRAPLFHPCLQGLGGDISCPDGWGPLSESMPEAVGVACLQCLLGAWQQGKEEREPVTCDNHFGLGSLLLLNHLALVQTWKKQGAPSSCHPGGSNSPQDPLLPWWMKGGRTSEKDVCSWIKVEGRFFSLARLTASTLGQVFHTV